MGICQLGPTTLNLELREHSIRPLMGIVVECGVHSLAKQKCNRLLIMKYMLQELQLLGELLKIIISTNILSKDFSPLQTAILRVLNKTPRFVPLKSERFGFWFNSWYVCVEFTDKDQLNGILQN